MSLYLGSFLGHLCEAYRDVDADSNDFSHTERGSLEVSLEDGA